jgi:TolB-like protein/DNA-binding winged helix-turn-helix (wHTH) protein/tetratricopeptide (TPR) repeat protein
MSNGTVHFGVFEANLRTQELRKHGHRLRVPRQSFQVLAALIDRPGELITRDELRAMLWPADTFVDFEHSLNAAVNRLRDALGDSAETPRFIETLPRRGYRFIGSIVTADVEPSNPDEAADKPQRESQPVAAAMPRRWGPGVLGRRMRWGLAGAAALLITLAIPDRVWRRHSTAAATPAIHALAVLPLDNLSGDPAQDYFVDGMTDALITNLAQIRSLNVISRTSTMRYKGTRKPLPDVGRELHADAIVAGAVIRVGNRIRIDAQLIEAATDRHLWSASYERNVDEVTSLQSDIARAVTNEIRVTLTPEERARLSRAASVDPETYDLYMKGRYLWSKRTDDSDRKSIDYFQAAIQRRPDYAPAYAAMADAYMTRKDLPPRVAFPKAKAAARTALRIDDTLGEAHTALAASLFYFDWDWAGAKQEFERALALNPNSALAHQWYGQYQKALGWKDWAAEVKRAGELDPLSPMLAGGGWYIEIGQYDRAIDLLSKKIELNPDLPFPHGLIGRAYTRKGMFPEAIRHLRLGVDLSAGAPEYLGSLGYTYGMAGRRAEAVEMIRRLEQLSNQRYVSPYTVAIVYAGLGEKDLAFARLDEAFADRAIQLVDLNVWGPMDQLRTDPRYAELKKRVGLPK